MKDFLLQSYDFNLRYAHVLVQDVEEATMTHSPATGLENHPAFTLGHLVSGSALTSRYLGGPFTLDPTWEKLFKRRGPGDPRKPAIDPAIYPNKSELLDALVEQHALVTQQIQELDKNRWMEPTKWRFSKHYPTLGGMLHFMCITHEAMHLGQLASWRRAMNMDSALAKM